MNGFEAYGFILAMVMCNPATAAAAGRVWARFLGICGKGHPPPIGSVTPLSAAERAEAEVLQKRIGSKGVRRGGKGANQ